MHHSVIVQETTNLNSQIGLYFLNYKLAGFTKPISEVDEIIIHLSLKICKTAKIDDVVIKWVKSENTWKFAGMEYPPQNIFTFNSSMTRKSLLCSMLKDILAGKEIPPWTKSHATKI